MVHVDSPDNEAKERTPVEEDKRTVVHLKKKYSDKECCKCNATLTDEGVYTYNEDVYKTPPVGYRNCRSMWAE